VSYKILPVQWDDFALYKFTYLFDDITTKFKFFAIKFCGLKTAFAKSLIMKFFWDSNLFTYVSCFRCGTNSSCNVFEQLPALVKYWYQRRNCKYIMVIHWYRDVDVCSAVSDARFHLFCLVTGKFVDSSSDVVLRAPDQRRRPALVDSVAVTVSQPSLNIWTLTGPLAWTTLKRGRKQNSFERTGYLLCISEIAKLLSKQLNI